MKSMFEEYIKVHYRENISLEKVAQDFYYSRAYFSKLFHRQVGIPFNIYLRRYRLEQAMDDLCDTEKSVECIALDNGFSDTRQYINTFKQVYQTTPYQYRLKLRHDDQVESYAS